MRPATARRRPCSGDRRAVLGDPRALDDLFRVHLAAHGPASRHDLSWWSGQRLGVVDEALERLALPSATGPDGREYVDLPAHPPPRSLSGVRLLPEFDALFCAYQPAARTRFITPEHHDSLWLSANGVVKPPLLVDGRMTGYWRAMGSARKRPLEVSYFARHAASEEVRARGTRGRASRPRWASRSPRSRSPVIDRFRSLDDLETST